MTISVRKADFSEIFKIRDLASVTIPTSYQNNLTTEQIDYLEDFLYAQQTLADSEQSKQVFLIASSSFASSSKSSQKVPSSSPPKANRL